MTHIFNDPAEFAGDALEGFALLHCKYVRRVPGGVVRQFRSPGPKVAVVVGGGSGHYPAFAGLVGQGYADGAVVGNIFTSPSSHYAYSVGKQADTGRGVIFSYGNYAGDVMNFGIATEQLKADGIDVRNVLVTDDVASGSADETHKRRGIAGDFVVFKVMGAAAEAGCDLDAVEAVGRKANDRTRTIGTAFSGCTFPGNDVPLFTVPHGQMGLGLGIQGEAGLHNLPIPSAKDLAGILVDRVLQEKPDSHSGRVAAIVNGLGSTKQEELFVLWGAVAPLLAGAGLDVVEPEVGELVTSLDMAGVSLTLLWLDDELEQYWCAAADTPAYRKSAVSATTGVQQVEMEDDQLAANRIEPGSGESHAAAQKAAALLQSAAEAIVRAEPELGRIDAVAGDGDHGRGMVRGIQAALAAAAEAVAAGAGAGTTVQRAGDAWASDAGGTSGVLWGSALQAFGGVLGDGQTPTTERILDACEAFVDRLVALGNAQPGDKTMVDAAGPFLACLRESISAGTPFADALHTAAAEAQEAAQATAALTPKLGRARPLAERSVGTPDAGAVSFALIVGTLAGETA
jgi:dihydroxyacetone kinase